MARILLFGLPERSHVNASLGLAKALAARGHEVAYLITADLEAHVLAQGLRAHVVLTDVVPLGTRERMDSDADLERIVTGRMHARIAAGGLDAVLGEQRPDLVLVDTWAPSAAFAAHRLGIRVVMTSPTLPRAPDPLVPDPTQLLVPDRALVRARLRVAWVRKRMKRRITNLVREDHAGGFRSHARAAQYPMHELDTSAGFPRLIAFRELVLCPREFDLPRERELSNIRYAESFVDLDRKEPHVFDASWLEPGVPLVYVSFGTLTHRNHRIPRLLATVVRGLTRSRTKIQVVVSAAPRDTWALEGLPAHVRVMNAVPQLEVLRRSALMINHGGLNSIKECIETGVPMLVVPWAQPLNAVRVAFHGLGRVLPPRLATTESVRRDVDELLSDDRARGRVRAMQARFRAATAAGIGVSVIEAELARR